MRNIEQHWRTTCLRVALAFSVVSAAACTIAPYAEVDGRLANQVDPLIFDVMIAGVDGQAYFDGRRNDTLEPGVHRLLLASTKPGQTVRSTRELFIDAKPCTRYSIVAKHGGRFDAQDWAPEVVSEIPISNCKVRESKP